MFKDVSCLTSQTRFPFLEDTLKEKIQAWKDPGTRQSKKIKDLSDIARLVESHPYVWEKLDDALKEQINRP